MVIVPAVGVAGVLEDAEAAGVTTATIYSAAMGDGPDPESHKRGAWLKDFLGRSKIKVAGPNCMGAYSYHDKIFAYPNNELCRFPAGSVSAAFQSGGTLQFWLRTSADRGLRFSYGITSGNEISFDLADYLNFLVDDPHTKVIALFIEGIRRPDAFMAAAARALAAGKPIVAIKTGATAKSQAAAQSHTGAIGGDYAAYLAMCERYGIYNCRNLDDMMEAALAFDGGRLPKGPRIGFVTTSGGTVDLLYDYAEFEGASMPDYSAETLKGLDSFHAGRDRAQEPARPRHPRRSQAGGRRLRGGREGSQHRHDRLGRDAAEQGRRLGRRRDAASHGEGHRQADRRLRAHELPDDARSGRSADAGRLPVPARTGADHPRAQRALVPRPAHRQAARRCRPLPRRAIFSRRRSTPRSRNTALRCRKSREVATAAEAAAAAEAIGFPVVLKIRSHRHPAQDRSRRRCCSTCATATPC